MLRKGSSANKIALMAAESVCEERANLGANSKTGAQEREEVELLECII